MYILCILDLRAFFPGSYELRCSTLIDSFNVLLKLNESRQTGMLRQGYPVGLVLDYQILGPDASALAREWPVLVAPAKGSLIPRIEEALATFSSAGGTLIRLKSQDRWDQVSRLSGIHDLCFGHNLMSATITGPTSTATASVSS